MTSLLAAMTAAVHVLAVVTAQVRDVDELVGARSRCYVVTIFGLKTADCGKQSARSVPASLDSDLQVLRFEDNRLTVLGDGEFSAYANLQEIYLARNRIELIETTALRGLYSLQILDLEANQLTAVPAKSLRAVATSLRLLSLKNNPIRRLEADALSSLTRLEEINLEDCWLEYLDPLSFSGLDRLSAVNLVNNELRGVDATMQSTLPSSLRVVRLYRNPWTCDCRLRWLRRWLVAAAAADRRPPSSTAKDQVDTTINWDFASNTPTCAAPALIRGVAWRHLTPDQFACPSRIVAVTAPAGTTGNSSTTTTGLRAIAGSNATVECVAAGDPEPIISWSRGERRGGSELVRLAPPKALISVRQGTAADDAEPRIVSVLILVRVTSDGDSGDYTCMAENTAGRAEMTFTLTVDKAPLRIASSGGDLWPIDRDAFLGVLIGLPAIACVIVVCTVLRLYCIAQRRRRRRMHNKNVYYLADTGNHVGPSPVSNRHTHGESIVVTETTFDDHVRKSSDEQNKSSYLQGDTKLESASAGHLLLVPNHNHLRPAERIDSTYGRPGGTTDSEADPGVESDVRLNEAARRLLGPERRSDSMDLGETNVDSVDNVDDDDDGVSVSEKLSSDSSVCETDELRTNHRGVRPSRAVSFGPDMIIDARRSASSSGDRAASPPVCDDVVQLNDDVVDDQSEDDDSRSRHDDEPVFQRINPCSPSLARRPLLSHPDRRTPTFSPPAVVDGQRSQQFAGQGVGVGRRHSGDVRLVGNGSVRRGPASYQLGRPLSPQTPCSPSSVFTQRPLASETSGSLEPHDKTRRRLPLVSAVAASRSASPGVLAGASRRRGTSASPHQLLGNHVADVRTPMSLAELLAPPFGGASSRNSSRSPCTPVTQRFSPSVQSVFDDDSGTDI